MIARAPIAAGPVARRSRQARAIGADVVVPFAVSGMVALDRRGMSARVERDGAVAGDRDRLDRAVRGADMTHVGAAAADVAAPSGEGVMRAG